MDNGTTTTDRATSTDEAERRPLNGDLRSATSFSRTLHYDIPSQFNAGSVSSKHPPLIPPPAPAKTISISKVIDHKELCRSSFNINITKNNKQDMLDKGGGEGRGLVEIAKNM